MHHVNSLISIAIGRRDEREVWFYKASAERSESHWNVYSGGEVWYCVAGRDNLFYAIALFLHHVKIKMGYVFYDYNYRDIINKLLT